MFFVKASLQCGPLYLYHKIRVAKNKFKWTFLVIKFYDPVAGRGTPSRVETGLLSNTQKWIVRGDTSADKARDFIGKGHPGGEQEGKGTQDNVSVTWLAV